MRIIINSLIDIPGESKLGFLNYQALMLPFAIRDFDINKIAKFVFPLLFEI